MLKFIKEVEERGANGHKQGLYQCHCGNKKILRQDHVLTGNTKTCGHKIDRHTHTHSYKRTPTYVSWHSMMRRCYTKRNGSYKSYGAKGIRVNKRWHTFSKFLKDMGERPEGHSISRKNHEKNYSPKNCVWAPIHTH